MIFVSPLEASRRPGWGDVCADTAPPAVSWLQTQGFPFLSPREPRAVPMVACGEQEAFHWLSGPGAEGVAELGPDCVLCLLTLSSPGAAAGLGSRGPEGSPGDS